MADGWVKLHRKLLDNPIVCKDSDHLAVWMYLLLNATHAEYDTTFEGKKITLQAGQLKTGRQKIGAVMRITESKVQRILKLFENEQQIEQRTDMQSRIITILNWNEYQKNEQRNEQGLNNDRTTSEQRVNTNKNVKKEKNVNKNTYSECVLLTDNEYQKLIAQFGEQGTKIRIQNLNDYILSVGKKYVSHYHTILNWERKNNPQQQPPKMTGQERLNRMFNKE
jgi:hypothetical protein